MARIPEETIETIRDRVDIADLIGRYVSLRQTGRSFKGLCPFHDEKTPSFHVNPERGIFHCFGCGAGGDAFQFLVRHENLTFPEAVRSLGRDLGVEVPETGEGGESGLFEKLRRANDVAQDLYLAALGRDEARAAQEYLKGRGFDGETARRFGIGYAPDRWDAVEQALRRAKVDAAIGERAGLLSKRRGGEGHYDLLRGRITFPIQDVRGRVVGFGGRALSDDQSPKYLNTPETPLFRKREAFYGFPEALEPMRREGRAVVAEGYFDRIALARAGVEESVATCGTALTREHARNLHRRAPEVVLLFDGDEAGQRAMERSLEILLPEGLRVRAGALPPGRDPADLLESDGPEALRKVVDDAPPALESVIRRAVARGRSTPWEKADAVGAVSALLALVPDAVERGEYARWLAAAVDVRPSEVEAAVRRAHAQRRGGTRSGETAQELESWAPRVEGPEHRVLRRVAGLLIDHSGLGTDLRPLLELELPEPWAELVPALAEAGTSVASLGDRLGDAAARELRALVVEERLSVGPEEAQRTISDTIAELGERQRLREERAATRRLREDPNADAESVLREKQRQIERRRAAQRPRAS